MIERSSISLEGQVILLKDECQHLQREVARLEAGRARSDARHHALALEFAELKGRLEVERRLDDSLDRRFASLPNSLKVLVVFFAVVLAGATPKLLELALRPSPIAMASAPR